MLSPTPFTLSPHDQPQPRRYWVGVVSAEHVRHALDGGYIQVCHGKLSALKRARPGDGFAYYSPNQTFKGKERHQRFTAIGIINCGEPYRFDMGDGFEPHRRDVDWVDSVETAIRPLLNQLEFTAGRTNWGYALRVGLFSISEHDFRLIAAAMHADLSRLFSSTAPAATPLNQT
ncbi:EVE domain-containing protein [Dickeya dadantii]|uniref:EVE domain-containing protein n=1 Tax=Dickeya dadantii TaxID=204038 RepID=UPI0003A03FD2|nr:EVE domain-containing protein [Dickeya dadantii]